MQVETYGGPSDLMAAMGQLLCAYRHQVLPSQGVSLAGIVNRARLPECAEPSLAYPYRPAK